MSNTWDLLLQDALTVAPIESDGLETRVLQNVRAVSAHAEAFVSEYAIVFDCDDPMLAEVQAARESHYRELLAARDAYIFEPTRANLQAYLGAVMSTTEAQQSMMDWTHKTSSVTHRPKSREFADRLFDRLTAQDLLG